MRGEPSARRAFPILAFTCSHSTKLVEILSCPVTVEDVTIADKIYGPDISSLKGKSTRRKPKPVKKDTIVIPKELIAKNHDIDLCIDTMFVNENSVTGISVTFLRVMTRPELRSISSCPPCMLSVGRTRYQEVRKRVEVRIRENDLVRQWGVVWSTNPR